LRRSKRRNLSDLRKGSRNPIVPFLYFIQAAINPFPVLLPDTSQQLPSNLLQIMEQSMKLIEQRIAFLQDQINQVISGGKLHPYASCTLLFVVNLDLIWACVVNEVSQPPRPRSTRGLTRSSTSWRAPWN
jgi:hypothetical protein